MKKWISGLAIFALAAAGMAQIDWPTHRGVAPRTGVNASPVGPNAGLAGLRWYFPLQSELAQTQGNFGVSTVVDNAMTGFTTSGTWTAPQPLDESGDFFSMVGSTTPPYVYAAAVSGRNIGDPTVGATSTATWTVSNLVPDRAYQLDVWFPSTGTTFNGNLLPNYTPARRQLHLAVPTHLTRHGGKRLSSSARLPATGAMGLREHVALGMQILP